MQGQPDINSRPFGGVLFSVLIGAIVVLLGLGIQEGMRLKGEMVDRAITYARSLSVVAEGELRGDASPGSKTRLALAALQEKVPELKAAAVVKEESEGDGGALSGLFASLQGKEILAHTSKSLVGQSLSEEAEEKDSALSQAMLYKRANTLKDRLKRNSKARKSDPSLAENPYPVVDVEVREDGDIFVMVPILVGGELKATAAVVVSLTEVVIPGIPVWMLVTVAAFLLLMLGYVLSRSSVPGLVAVGLLFVAPVMVISSHVYDRLSTEVVSSQTEAGIFALDIVNAASAMPAQRETVLKSFNMDVFGGERHLYKKMGGGVEAQSSALTASGFKRWWPPLFAGLSIVLTVLLFWTGWASRIWAGFSEHWFAYAYVAPAMIGMLLLVFAPFSYGLGLAFFARLYGSYHFVFFDNFIEILGSLSIGSGFYRTFGVTILWTASNVFLHVSIGLGLALLLRDKSLGGTPIYRSLLIVPWAVPNYITALIWKGLFNKEFGAINAFLAMFGVDKISWFDTFWKAFFANVATNTWLGFPFMMVVSLGALQSIPQDLYEAADVDGADKWAKFRFITVPLLKPALFPAIILGIIWTFNMFNVIYLVSGGAPDGQTEILITEAYRWAFERGRYGYAAAYSTIIFLILLSYTLITNKLTRATEGAFD